MTFKRQNSFEIKSVLQGTVLPTTIMLCFSQLLNYLRLLHDKYR